MDKRAREEKNKAREKNEQGRKAEISREKKESILCYPSIPYYCNGIVCNNNNHDADDDDDNNK